MFCTINACMTGYKIRDTFRSHNVSVKDIAHSLNVSTQTIYKWLNGQSLPTLENVMALSKCLNVPVESLIATEVNYDFELPEYMVRENILVQ